MTVTTTQRLAYKPAEVAEMLGLTVRTIYRMIHDEELPYIHRGQYLIPAKALEDWIAENTHTSEVA